MFSFHISQTRVAAIADLRSLLNCDADSTSIGATNPPRNLFSCMFMAVSGSPASLASCVTWFSIDVISIDWIRRVLLLAIQIFFRVTKSNCQCLRIVCYCLGPYSGFCCSRYPNLFKSNCQCRRSAFVINHVWDRIRGFGPRRRSSFGILKPSKYALAAALILLFPTINNAFRSSVGKFPRRSRSCLILSSSTLYWSLLALFNVADFLSAYPSYLDEIIVLLVGLLCE